MGTDSVQTYLEAGDEGFEDSERMFNEGTSFNTGTVLLDRATHASEICAIWGSAVLKINF